MALIKIFIEAYKGSNNKKIISRIYSSLRSERGLSTTYIKSRWEKETKIELTNDEWLNICKTQSVTTSSDLWREFAWKNTVRFFITPKIKKSQTKNPEHSQCWRKCGNMSAGHFHIFWECPAVALFWASVTTEIRSITGLKITFSFSTIYLGNLPAGLEKHDQYLLQILLVSCKNL